MNDIFFLGRFMEFPLIHLTYSGQVSLLIKSNKLNLFSDLKSVFLPKVKTSLKSKQSINLIELIMAFLNMLSSLASLAPGRDNSWSLNAPPVNHFDWLDKS